MYEVIKQYYQWRLFSLADMQNFVATGWITEQQYQGITGENYSG